MIDWGKPEQCTWVQDGERLVYVAGEHRMDIQDFRCRCGVSIAEFDDRQVGPECPA